MLMMHTGSSFSIELYPEGQIMFTVTMIISLRDAPYLNERPSIFYTFQAKNRGHNKQLSFNRY